VREYPGNYHAYVNLRRERQLSEARVYEKQLDKIRAEEEYIRKLQGRSAGEAGPRPRGPASSATSTTQLVERAAELDVMHLSPADAAAGRRHGRDQRRTSRRSASAKRGRSSSDVTITVKPGDRIGIIGPNGAGKTTMVRALLGDLEPDTGIVRRSPRLAVGWFRQTQDHLDLSLTVWQFLQSVIIGLDGTQLERANSRLATSPARSSSRGATRTSRSPCSRAASGPARSSPDSSPAPRTSSSSTSRRTTSTFRAPSGFERSLLDYGCGPDDAGNAGGSGGALLLITHDRALLDAVCDRLDGPRRRRPNVIDLRGRLLGVHREVPAGRSRAREGRGSEGQCPRRRQRQEAAGAARLVRQAGTRCEGRARARMSKLSLDEIERRIEALETRLRAYRPRARSTPRSTARRTKARDSTDTARASCRRPHAPRGRVGPAR
jgi:ATPase subunit of ABC transporter with duplicated ATPase domains